jgi:hypothetical protein
LPKLLTLKFLGLNTGAEVNATSTLDEMIVFAEQAQEQDHEVRADACFLKSDGELRRRVMLAGMNNSNGKRCSSCQLLMKYTLHRFTNMDD